jgi:hypothetical protein
MATWSNLWVLTHWQADRQCDITMPMNRPRKPLGLLIGTYDESRKAIVSVDAYAVHEEISCSLVEVIHSAVSDTLGLHRNELGPARGWSRGSFFENKLQLLQLPSQK